MMDVSITITVRRVPQVVIPLYQYGDDYQVLGGLRACASGGCPAVMVLSDAPDTIFDLHWQMYVYAINLGMDLSAIIALMGNSKALFNNTGFGADPPRANYLTGNNLTATPPRLDKLRTFALNTHTGTETYSLAFALANILASLRQRSFLRTRHALSEIASTNVLIVQTMDGNQPPPMKPNTRRPTRVEEVNPDDYQILPATHRQLFLDCTNIKSLLGGDYKVGPFAHGSVRPWTQDGEMHSFIPLVSIRTRVITPLGNWKKIPLGDSFPSPFRRP